MADAAPLEVSPQQVHAMLTAGEDVYLLDCREPQEHRVANVEGFQLVPMGDVPGRLQELSAHAEKPVVVMCHHGMRSLQVARYLRQQGFEEAASMRGGIDAWSRDIDPAVPRY